MATLKVNGEIYKHLVINGAANLRANYKVVDALNVFPVPDGDTGTNMRMTIEAGATAIKDANESSIYEMAKKVSRGMLMGARGNSGVILSQIMKGIAKTVSDSEYIDAKLFAKAIAASLPSLSIYLLNIGTNVDNMATPSTISKNRSGIWVAVFKISDSAPWP